MAETVLTPAGHNVPPVLTQQKLGWLPWLEPLPADAMTDRHWAGLVDSSRAKSAYFMLLGAFLFADLIPYGMQRLGLTEEHAG